MPDASSIYKTITASAGSKRYDIIIGANLLTQAGHVLSNRLPSKKVCIVTDETVAKLYLFPLMQALESAGFHPLPPIILPAGEGSKNFDNLQHIIDKSLSYKLDRKSTLIALGGGVIGDITGFAASMIMRGIGFVQIPTTLLAQVDSSVGGKTAINTKHGKNLVGAFYQPLAVLIDTNTTTTLSVRELKAGYAEVVKYGLISAPDFFLWLEESAAKLFLYDRDALRYVIEKSCSVKAKIVEADETEEKDIRALLNLGHTFAHALEALAGYDGSLLHGEAVSIGMTLAFDFSARQGLCSAVDAQRVRVHLEQHGLMTDPPFDVAPDEMLEKMRSDKKKSGDNMTLILAKGIGQAFVAKDIDEKDVRLFLQNRFTQEI